MNNGLKEGYSWPTVCDGKEVINGMIGLFGMHDDWCEEI